MIKKDSWLLIQKVSLHHKDNIMNQEIDIKLAELGYSSRDEAYLYISAKLLRVNIFEYRKLKKLLQEINDADELDSEFLEKIRS